MSEVIAITLGFVPSRILEQSFASYYRTRNPELTFRHFFVNQHYPLDKRENTLRNREICERYGVYFLDPGRNLGLHEGFNWALQQIRPLQGSVVIAYDPDVNPISPGWDMALVRAILGDPERRVVWSSLIHTVAAEEINKVGYDTRRADGYIEMWLTRRPIMNSICAWSFDWLKSVGFLREPRPFYGHLEAEMFNKLGRNQWAFLPGWTEDESFRHQQDDAYKTYKWVHAHHKSWDGDFESWLAAGSPNPAEEKHGG